MEKYKLEVNLSSYMPERQEKNKQLYISAAIFSLGLFTAIGGLIFDDHFLILFISGVIVMASGFLAWHVYDTFTTFRNNLYDLLEEIEEGPLANLLDNISEVCADVEEFRSDVEEFRSDVEEFRAKTEMRFPILYTKTEQENWRYAMNMIMEMGNRWRGYDISSYESIDEFERKFFEKVSEGVTFYRIIACDPDRDTATSNWLKRIVDADCDTDNEYDGVREAIDDGSLKILHLPHSVYADFFIIEDEGGRQAEVVFGFPKELETHSYQSGMYSANRDVVDDFKDFFLDTVWKEATRHLNQVQRASQRGENICPICSHYVDQSKNESLGVKK